MRRGRMKGSEIESESESEKGRAVGWGGGRDCCWWLGCTCDIRRYLRAKKNVHDIRCHYRIATGHLVAYPSEVVEEWGGGASMSPAVVWNHDDPHPALLLASRSLAAGASACTPCGAGSYYGWCARVCVCMLGRSCE